MLGNKDEDGSKDGTEVIVGTTLIDGATVSELFDDSLSDENATPRAIAAASNSAKTSMNAHLNSFSFHHGSVGSSGGVGLSGVAMIILSSTR